MIAMDYIRRMYFWNDSLHQSTLVNFRDEFIADVFDRVLIIPAGIQMTQVEMDDPDGNPTTVVSRLDTATTNRNAQVWHVRCITDQTLIFSIVICPHGDVETTIFYEVDLYRLVANGGCYFETSVGYTLQLSFNEVMYR